MTIVFDSSIHQAIVQQMAEGVSLSASPRPFNRRVAAVFPAVSCFLGVTSGASLFLPGNRKILSDSCLLSVKSI
ncbi:hypothetical protein [Desulfuromonas thiophila]|uniref:Uncharacterized protein n=1 Tax=Desulfuromonas thiophila TaxID=57664 RepID=A0A1G7CU63_9BACT|nr:hypothetical protein [Desulfuromonas thiophila]SDE42055.1 hypothetical protein SAMN05661003_11088 [Desulfuromonas thiophila]